MASSFTIQNELDKIRTFAVIEPVYNVPGYPTEPILSCANDTMTAICGVNFPHKWNEQALPLFYTNSFQQDYALVDANGNSITNVEWLERGVAFDINNSAIPKPYVDVECGRSQPQRTGTYLNPNGQLGSPAFIANSFPNYSLYYGIWGQTNTGNKTLGNNPVANSVYTFPLGAQSQPANPIIQIIDANGNLLVLTTYGHEGSAAPVAPANSAPGVTASGTGATTVWTVVDPNGTGIRILPVPSQTGNVWQFNLVGQKTPIVFANLQQKLDPLPDKYEPFFRAGLIAQSYRYSPEKKVREKFEIEWKFWLASLQSLREVQDRELEEYGFTLDRTIMGRGKSDARFQGPAWPFNNPRL